MNCVIWTFYYKVCLAGLLQQQQHKTCEGTFFQPCFKRRPNITSNFTNMPLACNDCQPIEVNKIILSAANHKLRTLSDWIWSQDPNHHLVWHHWQSFCQSGYTPSLPFLQLPPYPVTGFAIVDQPRLGEIDSKLHTTQQNWPRKLLQLRKPKPHQLFPLRRQRNKFFTFYHTNGHFQKTVLFRTTQPSCHRIWLERNQDKMNYSILDCLNKINSKIFHQNEVFWESNYYAKKSTFFD